MHLECPKCFKDNEIRPKEPITCKHCSEDISDYKYRKPLISATAALCIGVGGFYATDKYLLAEDRYPVAVEHSIIEACVSSYQEPMSYPLYENKQRICICVLEETMKDVSFKKYNENDAEFLIKFKTNVKQCK